MGYSIITILFLGSFVNCEIYKESLFTDKAILIDDINSISRQSWIRTDLTWSIMNYTKQLKEEDIYNSIYKAFEEWESISVFTFHFKENDNQSDILFYFVNFEHSLHDKDKKFSSEGVLAHATFPEIDSNGKMTSFSGDIHFNNDINDWSLSSKSGSSIFHVVLHEIGHSLGLSHVLDKESVMYPVLIYRPDNFTLRDDTIDYISINMKYPKVLREDKEDSTTTFPTTLTPKTCINNFNSGEYEGFECKEVIDWCVDNLYFSNIYSLDDKLYVYKKNLFWIVSMNDNKGFEFSSQAFSHEIYFHEPALEDNLISVVKIKKHNVLALFYKNKGTIKNLKNCLHSNNLELNKLNKKLDVNINGLYYNSTEDSMFMFSKYKPLSYIKVSRFSEGENMYEEKPIELFHLDKYDYDKVFEFNNKVFFMRDEINPKFDYFDWGLKVLVKNISFRNYFLRDECDLLPIKKN